MVLCPLVCDMPWVMMGNTTQPESRKIQARALLVSRWTDFLHIFIREFQIGKVSVDNMSKI